MFVQTTHNSYIYQLGNLCIQNINMYNKVTGKQLLLRVFLVVGHQPVIHPRYQLLHACF